MIKRLCIISSAISVVVVYAQAGAPLPRFSEGVPPAERALAKLALDGWWDGRERLISGMATASLSRSREGNAPAKDTQYLAFDRSKSLLRFDVTTEESIFRLARTPLETLLYRTGFEVIERQAPNYAIPSEDLEPFEPWLVGVVSLGEFDARLRPDAFAEFVGTTTCTACQRRPDKSIELQLEQFLEKYQERFRRTVIFLPTRDYAAVEFRRDVLSVPPMSALKVGPMDVVRARWEKSNEVWVPVQADFEDFWGRETASIQFKWASVNQAIDKRLFQPEGFEAPPEAAIVEYRLGEPIFEREVGSHRQIDRVNMTRETASAPNWRSWVLWGNLAAITVIGGLLLRRWARSP